MVALDGEVGSLEPGKLADLTVLSLAGSPYDPVEDPVAAALAYFDEHLAPKSAAAISLIERGKRTPSLPVALRLARLYGVRVEDLLDLVEVPA